MTTQLQHAGARLLGGPAAVPFWAVHVAAVVGVASTGWSWTGLGLAVGLYYSRMFFVTAGYHRYFSHRAFKTSRPVQLALALGATLSAQKGVLWWAANHRLHHRDSDSPADVHSPRQRGLWWAHLGWILCSDHAQTQWRMIPDFGRYPELRWLDRHYLVPPIALAATLFLIGGWWALLWGFLVSTTLLWHGTFLVNSLAHVVGSRRYETRDDSRNSAGIAVLTMGEGWHNNHHRFAASARQGFFWWEVDATYYLLWAMARVGLIWDVRPPPMRLLDEGRATDESRSRGMGRWHALRSSRRTRAVTEDAAARVTVARRVLQAARDKLDEAVAALPDCGAGSAMATPALLRLLIRVVEARRQLDGLELLLVQSRVN
jgi:stearoyl-CoA desaturase (Delta-9 desaturase)